MSDFTFERSRRDDDDDRPARSRSRPAAGPSWLHSFSATFAAVLLAGVLLLVGIRVYVAWSVSEAFKNASPATNKK